MFHALHNHLRDATPTWMLSANGLVAIVTLAEIEAILKVVLLLVSIGLTATSWWLKMRKARK